MAADHTGTAPPRTAPDVRTVETSQLRRAGLKITIQGQDPRNPREQRAALAAHERRGSYATVVCSTCTRTSGWPPLIGCLRSSRSGAASSRAPSFRGRYGGLRSSTRASTTTTSSARAVAGSRSSAMTASKNARKKSRHAARIQARRPLADFARPLRPRELPTARRLGSSGRGRGRTPLAALTDSAFRGRARACVRSRSRRRASVRSPRPLLHRPAVRAAYGSGPSR